MLSRFAFAFFAIFYPSRYFFIAMLCLFLTFWMSASLKANHPNDSLGKKLFGLFPMAQVTGLKSSASQTAQNFLPYFLVGFLHSPSRTGVEPNCPTAMHFRIFRRAFARKMVITEESQIIRPATSNFCVLCRNSPCKMRILLRLASTKSIKNCNAGGCFAVLSEQILCRCKEKMRSNISYCENFICSKCGYLSLKTVWIWLSSVMLLRKITPKSIKNAFADGCEQF